MKLNKLASHLAAAYGLSVTRRTQMSVHAYVGAGGRFTMMTQPGIRALGALY